MSSDWEEKSQMKAILPPEHLRTWMYDLSLGVENRCKSSESDNSCLDIYDESKLMYIRGMAAGISKGTSGDDVTYEIKIGVPNEIVDGINDGERLAAHTCQNV
jgi:hypothetical protein